MTRTTPPPPADIAAVFPELAPLARTCVRLHPRPAEPTVADSSVGGPLLWPADESWPTCPEQTGPWLVGYDPGDLRRQRRILTEGWARPRFKGKDFLTPEERAFVQGLGYTGVRKPLDGQVPPALPVLQLYARDVPSLPRPEGTDLLQVLWCSFEHGEDCMPGVQLRRRTAADVGEVHDEQWPPVVSEDGYLPEPCLLPPEPAVEYPARHELDEDLHQRILTWEEGSPYDYQSGLAVAPGWKLGGYGNWSFCDPWPMNCEECDPGVEHRSACF